MPKKSPQHGGVREGAGRKPLDPNGSILVCASLPAELVKQIDAIAKEKEWTRAETVREAVKMLLDSQCSGGVKK